MLRMCTRDEIESVLSWLEERFGIGKQHFSRYGFYMGGKTKVYIGPSAVPGNPRPAFVGISVMRLDGMKPTSAFLSLFGNLAGKNIVNLGKEGAKAYGRGDDVDVISTAASDGYAVVTFEGVPLGCGLLKGTTLQNVLPKQMRMEVTKA